MWHLGIFSIRLVVISTIFLFFTSASGQENSQSQMKDVPKMTLADSVILALKNNLDLRSAYLDRIVQRFNLKVAEYKLQPHSSIVLSSKLNSTYGEAAETLSIYKLLGINEPTPKRYTGTNQAGNFAASLTIPTGGSFNFTWDNKADKRDFSEDYTYNPSWNLTFVQPLLKGFGIDVTTASVKIAQINEEQNVLALQSTITSIISLTMQAYRSYVQAIRQLDISKRSLEMSKKLYEINRALIEGDIIPAVDIIQTEADIANRELGVIQAENNVESTRLSLIQILNIDRETLFEPVEEAETKIIPPPFQEAMTIARNNRPDYLQTLQDVEVSKLNFVVAKRNQLWDLSLESGVGRSVTKNEYGSALGLAGHLGRSDWNIGLKLTIPIGDLTIEQAYVNAKVGFDKANLNLKKLETNLGIEIKNALREAEIKFKQMEQAKRAVALAKKKLEIENEKLVFGRSTNFQLLSFQQDLVNTQINELSAVIDYLNSLTKLDQTLGTTLRTWKIEVKRDDQEIRLPNLNQIMSR